MKKLTTVLFALLLTQPSFATDIGRNDHPTELNSNTNRLSFDLGYPGMNESQTECVYVTPTLGNGALPTREQFDTLAFASNFAFLDRVQSIKPIFSKGTLIYRLRSLHVFVTPVSFVTARPGESFDLLIHELNHSQQEIKVLLRRGACTK